MHHQWLVPAILGVISFWVVMTTSKPESTGNVMEPVDPKLCHRLCSNRLGNPGYRYTPLDLQCQLIVSKNSKAHLSQKGKSYPKRQMLGLTAGEELKCTNNARSTAPGKTFKCADASKQERQRKVSRVLIVPIKGHLQWRQLYLHNYSVVTYPYFEFDRVQAIAYIAAMGKLVMSRWSPKELFLVSVDNNEKTIIDKRRAFRGISVDDVKQLLFMSSLRTGRVQVMTTEGKHLKSIINLKWFFTGIATDSKRELIYVISPWKGLLKFTYKGVLQSVIVEDVSSVLCLDSERDVLYYMRQGNVFKLFLSNNTSSVIPTPFRPYPHTLHVFLHNLYLIQFNSRGTLAVLTENGQIITTLNTGYDSNRLLLCGLP